ncbi:hypothetical protein BABINDRAFT_167210 [Babjeviella inositovora NRRL Y-12698]|uniref:Ribophorin II C-terminal domain-containing protein n=1 Tax=Babjeviella inositovora NRRL Y-12698 TaxID=984486 RepID=A0A1E3QNT8_9ASCO|nr:uncharacterized protein BABINDRAFT_167210 [Babjeviella inositovora NRRL Y-12698]ODQ79341.1 hypothetical protein BABINDRAFT_167210 [Babjeviella inositovora NRRL Y-12698]
MLFLPIIGLLAQFASALTISEGSVTVGSQKAKFGFEAISAPLTLNAQDSITVSFKLDTADTPDQVMVLLGNERGLETSYFPVVTGTTAKLVIPAAKIPAALKAQHRLVLNLVLGAFGKEVYDDEDKGFVTSHEEPLFLQIGELQPSKELLQQPFESAPRFSAKPEIIHQFRDSSQTVNPAIALVFVGGIGALFVGLLGVWLSFGVLNVKNAPSANGNLVFHVGLLGSIVAFEVVFFKYYVSSSVFATIARIAVLAGPAVFSGSRVFREFAIRRK